MKQIENYENIILGTGNYENVLEGNRVSITGDGGNAWGYFGPSYRRLAPKLITYTPYAEKIEELKSMKQDLLNINEYLKLKEQIEDEYIKSFYETRLKYMDCYELLETLYRKYGNEIILLCHEPIDEFCHRRLVADYIELKTGIYIPEITYQEGKILKKNPIRYKNRLNELVKYD